MSNLTSQKTPTGTGKFPQSSIQRKGKNSTSTSRPHGKSKYAQKSRVKKNQGKPVAVKRGPVNTYTSVCCSAPATKKACVKVGGKDALVQGLGSWRCSACHKAAKVTVSKFKAAESLTKDGWKSSDQVLPGENVRATVPASTPTEAPLVV